MKIKLLYIGNKLSKHGNTQTSIETLGHFLEKEGYELIYASSKKNKIVRMLDMIFTTLRFHRKARYVLIDTYSTQNFWFAFVIAQLCRILGAKYITKLHGGDLPNRLNRSPYLSDIIFKNAFKIIAPSGYLFSHFSEKYPENLLLIANTVAINKYPFFKRESIEPKLLWVRSFSKIYNPKMAIQVLSELKKKYSNAQLCMVGPDKENLIPNCVAFAEELNVEVQFTGKLSKKKWVELSKEYSVFINTTYFDNTPVSVIEAMALGLPVVSTNVGGIPFLLEDKKNALLVSENDVFQMVQSIELLLKDSQLRSTIVDNARALVEDFDWETVKEKWFEILK
jgi:glycosyltransferase involved in cell wall biosynthesis